MKIHVVEFNDGTYGVRKIIGWWIFKSEPVYLDLKSNSVYFWGKLSDYFDHCKTPNKELAISMYQRYIEDEKIIYP